MTGPAIRARRLWFGTVLAGLAATVVASACLGPDRERPAQAPGAPPPPAQAPGTPQPPADTPGALLPFPHPATVGPHSPVDAAQLIAAAPSCRTHRCRLLAQANGFGPAGAVAALVAWDGTGGGAANYELVVTSATGELLWRSPEQRIGHANGYERFTAEGHNRLFLPLAVEPHGQILVVLEWRAQRVHDRGSLTTRRFYGDSVVFAEDRNHDGTAEIITQSHRGVADADTGGLVESTYTLAGDDYTLTGCRKREGESFEWTTRPPRGGRCPAP